MCGATWTAVVRESLPLGASTGGAWCQICSGDPQGYVPHDPLGAKQDAFAIKYGLPFEATQGGKETIYPEYELKLRKMLADMAKAPASSK